MVVFLWRCSCGGGGGGVLLVVFWWWCFCGGVPVCGGVVMFVW